MARKAAALAVLIGFALSSCSTASRPSSANDDDLEPRRMQLAPIGPAMQAASGHTFALEVFDDCAELLRYLKTNAQRVDLPLYGGHAGYAVDEMAASARAAPATAELAAQPSAGGGESADYSRTNVQETGVDEPDIVKTDGKTIFVVRHNVLHAIDVRDGRSRRADTLELPGNDHALLLAGDRLVALARWADVPAKSRLPEHAPKMLIATVDVSDPRSLRLVSRSYVEGEYVSARLAGGLMRIVLRTFGPAITDKLSRPDPSSPGADRIWKDRVRRAVQRTGLDEWIPNVEIYKGERREAGRAVRCPRVHRPKKFSGLSMVTVLTVDPANPDRREAAAVVGSGETVYASVDRLYVSTNHYSAPEPLRGAPAGADIAIAPAMNQTTQIHAFDISKAVGARYVASGQVTGGILNQWAFSEHEGFLRVATTKGEAWTGRSESYVTVLEENKGVLKRVGRVGGLGKGERIYAVRFIGDVGYVVTFRQVDPLYVIDLSNPERPRVTGELKIPGYSAYLHPVGDGRLLGIGQDATNEGRRLGAQASLFDVSDPTDPKRLDTLALGGETVVEHTHLAFLYWPRTRMAAVPVYDYLEQGEESFAGLVAFEIGRSELRKQGRVAHPRVQPGFGVPIERSLVVGDLLYTVSQAGLLASGLDDLKRHAWIRWPQFEGNGHGGGELPEPGPGR